MSNNRSSKSGNAKSNKKWLMYAITLSIPFLFFVFVELALRLMNYGNNYPLFIENPANSNYILPRPDVISRYFPENADKPSVTMEANFMLKAKPENGFRVIVQGGSTAAGFPYGLGASIAGTLDQRLKASLASKHVEVVNTAMSAVNSYSLLDMADEIIEQEPDLVLIYAGHNEYLGILGVGSNFTAMESTTTTRWFMRLKNLRLVQLLQSATYSLSDAARNSEQSDSVNHNSNTDDQRSRTFMAKVAKNKTISFDSTTYHEGLKQFEYNMRDLLQKYENAGIPVFISTIASNHRDQAPFSSSQPEARFEKTLKLLTSTSDEAELKNTLRQASLTLVQSTSADLHYKVATLAEQLGMHGLAKTHFQLAVDNDLLRFRAPSALNDIIRKLAKDYSAVLVDAEAELARRSKNGIIGKSLMLEHLHPNLRGYYVISNSFYKAIENAFNTSDTNGFKGRFTSVSIEQAWAERLVLPQEEYYGFATIQNLTSDYPFTTTPTTPTLPKPADWQQQLGQDFYLKQRSWLQMMELSLKRYTAEENMHMRAKTLQILADALPHNGLYNLQIAELKYKQRRYSESLHYYQRAKLAGAIGPTIDANIASLQSLINAL